MSEIEKVLVESAPHPGERRLLFDALSLYLSTARSMFSTGRLWIDGSFVTLRTTPPNDIDLCLVVTGSAVNALAPKQQLQLMSMLTHQGVSSNVGMTPRLQPMAGLIDAFLVDEADSANVTYWEHAWQLVTDPVTKTIIAGLQKGFVEVTW